MEKVNHPAHYNIAGRKECIDEIVEKYGVTVAGIFCLTNAYKYLYRVGMKAGESQAVDIAKARWYFHWINSEKRKQNLQHNLNDEELFEDLNSLWLDIEKGLAEYEE